MREVNAPEDHSLGARRVLRVLISYDEGAHVPEQAITPAAAFSSDIAFVGTCMRNEGRDAFVLGLGERGLDIAACGDRWQKSPLLPEPRPYWRGAGLIGADYVSAIRRANACLGVLPKGNRGLHTHRSVEAAFADALLCAEHTQEQLDVYEDRGEAVFWEDVADCTFKCLRLLDTPQERARIRMAGLRRMWRHHAGNEDVCRRILEGLFR